MDYPELNALLATLFTDQPFLQWLADFTLKSSAIIGVTWLLVATLRQRLSSESQHLFWLNSLLCIALLPVSAGLVTAFASVLGGGFLAGQITVLPGFGGAFASAGGAAFDGFLVVYLGVSGLLLSRLVLAALRLRALSAAAVAVPSEEQRLLLQSLRVRLGIKRPVTLKASAAIHSPISFGLFQPQIILPVAAASWPAATVEDVLIHELSHIRRLDWPTMLFCHVLVSLAWINPLVWLARNRIDAAAEQACDGAVVELGKDGLKYAESLLEFAQSNRQSGQRVQLAQMMFDQGNLASRIRTLLDETSLRGSSRLLQGAIAVLGFSVVFMSSLVAVFGAEEDSDYLPMTAITPQYPTLAAENGIEGWVLVSFTVNAQGTVDADTLVTLDAEPADVFERSAERAAAQFLFRPRVANGVAVAVPGVQYLFKYVLEDGGEIDGMRQPPLPRNSRVEQTE